MITSSQFLVPSRESVQWTFVKDAHPKPHAKYLVRRNGYVHTATPCYGMHAPWWVPILITNREHEPVHMLDTDEWMSLL